MVSERSIRGMMGIGHSQYSHLVLWVEIFLPATSELFRLSLVFRQFPHVSAWPPRDGLYHHHKVRMPRVLCAGQRNDGLRRRRVPVPGVANNGSVPKNELDQPQAELCLIHAWSCPLRERLRVSEGMIFSLVITLFSSMGPNAGIKRSSSISASISWS
jgi:hypothetical protein